MGFQRATSLCASQVGGTVLYFMIISERWESKTLRFICGTAYTFAFNGMHMLFAAMLSSTSATYLPALFYVSMKQTRSSVKYQTDVRRAKRFHVGFPPFVHVFHSRWSPLPDGFPEKKKIGSNERSEGGWAGKL